MLLSKKLVRFLTKPNVLVRFYSPDYVMQPVKEGHWVDPRQATERVLNIFAAHDNVDKTKLTATADFVDEMGLHHFDVIELLLEVEKDFFMEFSDETAENFKCIEDVVQYIIHWPFADSFWSFNLKI